MITILICTAICSTLIYLNHKLVKERDELSLRLLKSDSCNEYLRGQIAEMKKGWRY